ncbi:MAG: hypothetical protein DRO04_01880 [Candidatus Iainarchaeum archaeon]|uniref:ATP-dependent helicase C-terminal domain-containing protein n=1 Tax=Candidatus Iainarchaeum sp. TaxID=3101447 RepID=A0A497JH55_9ARCH|nr:MAG: hypothetical protein DRO04_01880 [Candidatus Diapherotrites archaeon]
MIPCLWLVSRLPIGFRVMEDAELLELATFVAAGREKCCLADVDREDVHDYCKHFRFRCKYFVKLTYDKIPDYAKSFQELLEIGKELEFCPYYAQEYCFKNKEIIVQSYYRRKIPALITVYDECHNLLIPRELELKIDSLNDIIVQLKNNCTLVNSSTIKSLVKLKNFAEDFSGVIDIKAFLDEESISELLIARKFLMENNIKSKLGRFLRLLASDVVYSEEGNLIGVRASRIFPGKKPYVMLSGTMLDEIKRAFSIDAEIVIPRKRKKGYILNWLTTSYKEFEENIKAYRKLLFLIRLKFKFKKIVVFGTNRVLKRFLDMADYYEEEFIRSEIPESWTGTLFLKARGRFAEGVDISADAIVMLGAPYLTPEVIQRLSRTYKRLGFENYWSLATDIPMLITTLQCIGRVTRNPTDEPLIILADSRYRRFKQLEKHLELEEIDKLDKIIKLKRNN